jgi:hypothetical protein
MKKRVPENVCPYDDDDRDDKEFLEHSPSPIHTGVNQGRAAARGERRTGDVACWARTSPSCHLRSITSHIVI